MGGGGAHNFCNPSTHPSSYLPLKGTGPNGQYSKLLNVQQVPAVPLMLPPSSAHDLTHGATCIPTNILTLTRRPSLRNIIGGEGYNRRGNLSVSGSSGLCSARLAACLAGCTVSRHPASRPNCGATTICSTAFLWCYPCSGFYVFTPPKTSRPLSAPTHNTVFIQCN